MAILSFPQSGLIDEVIIRKNEAGALRAYLHAKENAPPAQLKEINRFFKDQAQWKTVPYAENGRAYLEVRGFESEDELMTALVANRFAEGQPQYRPEPGDDIPLGDRVRKQALWISNLFYLVGDANFFLYGLKGREALDAAAGVFYGLGTVSSMIFGRKEPSERQIHDISEQMTKFMNEKQIQIPYDASIHALIDESKKGSLQKLDDWLCKYPAEAMNLFFSCAGICIAAAAARKLKANHDPREAFAHKMDIGLGSCTFLSGTIANMIPEKAPDPDNPPHTMIDKAWEKIQEHPMTVAAVGYIVSTMFHTVSTFKIWGKEMADFKAGVGPKPQYTAIFNRAMFIGANIAAELVLMLASKGHGAGVRADGSIDETIMNTAADIIAKQPIEMQEELIGHVANFLGRPDTLALRDAQVKDALRQRVMVARSNPWTGEPSKQIEQPIEVGVATAVEKEKPKEPADKSTTSWAERAHADVHTTSPSTAIH